MSTFKPDATVSDSSSRMPETRITIRAVLVGLSLSVVVSFWGQIASDQLGYDPTYAQLPACLILPFLLLVLAPNLLLSVFKSRLVLSRSELIAIFAMGWVASMVPDRAMTRYLIAVITTPNYFASPENQWMAQFFEFLPAWLVLGDENGAVSGFFEGIRATDSVPWRDWVTPLFWWCSAIAALMWIGACIIVILRKQWVEHDRLRFPLGEVALHLMGGQDPNFPARRPFFKTGIFKIGLLISLLVQVWNVLSYWNLWPSFPILGPDSTSITLDPSFPAIPIRLNLFILCISFFANMEILFSVWFFLLLGLIQQGVLARLGFVSTASTIVPGGLVSIQSIGGMIMYVIIGLWMARKHLQDVWRKALGHDSELKDSDELFSYRTAVIGVMAGVLYISLWLHQAGMSFPIIGLFLLFLFMFYLAIARVVAEAGLVMIDLPINAHEFTVGMVGSVNLSGQDVTALGLTNAFARNWRTFTMIGISHVAWLREQLFPERRQLFMWCAIAFGVSTLVSFVYIIFAGYEFGAQNLRTNPGGLGTGFYNAIIAWTNNATLVSALEMSFLMSGGVLMVVLSLCRYLFYWWPLHPIGLVVVASAPARGAIFPIFLAWFIQAILLRIGGGKLYRDAQPFFIGILIGYVLGQGLSFLVDSLWFPDAPHQFEVF